MCPETLREALAALKKAEDHSDWNTELDEQEKSKETRKQRQKRPQRDNDWEPPRKVDRRMSTKGTVRNRLAMRPAIKLKNSNKHSVPGESHLLPISNHCQVTPQCSVI